MLIRPCLRVLGVLLLLLSVSTITAVMWSSYEYHYLKDTSHLNVLKALLSTLAIGCSLSALCFFLGEKQANDLGKREASLIVSTAWILGAGLAALPFFIWAHLNQETHEFLSWINCYFEAMSGITTTGASILASPSSLPKGLLFWRAQVQWIGGLGIVVLFVAVIPIIAKANKKIFKAETSSIGTAQEAPSLHEMARTIWALYAGLTLAQVLLMVGFDSELSWFTAITFGFSTTATAGYSILNDSAGSLLPSVQWIILIFMFLSGINYSLYYQTLKGKPSVFLKNSEFKTYIGITLLCCFGIASMIHSQTYPDMLGNEVKTPGFFKALLDSSFQVISIHTTTGFSTVATEHWPQFVQFLLLLLMFVGGCSGSTGGGIKVIRFIALYKLIRHEVERSFRPNVVRPCLIDGTPLSGEQNQSILMHFIAIAVLIAMSTLVVLYFNPNSSILTAFSACIACINNIGPGFGGVGVAHNYLWLDGSSKALLAALMVLGRLEVFTILALCSRKFWRY